MNLNNTRGSRKFRQWGAGDRGLTGPSDRKKSSDNLFSVPYVYFNYFKQNYNFARFQGNAVQLFPGGGGGGGELQLLVPI